MITYKGWDSNLLGLKCGQLEIGYDNDDLDNINFYDYEYVISKIRSDRIDVIQKLEKLGFYVVDILFEFFRETGTYVEPYDPSLIRVATKSDLPKLYALSDETFYLSRYHLDKFLDQESVSDLYRAWIKNAVDKVYGDEVFVAEEGHDLLGLSTCRLNKKDGIIDLTSSINDVGYELLLADIGYFISKQRRYILASTQAYNSASISLLKRLDFEHKDSYVTLAKGIIR